MKDGEYRLQLALSLKKKRSTHHFKRVQQKFKTCNIHKSITLFESTVVWIRLKLAPVFLNLLRIKTFVQTQFASSQNSRGNAK